MINKDYIEKEIKHDWRDNGRLIEICLRILDYVYKGANIYTHISFGSLNQLLEGKFSEVEILKAIQYLCGDKVEVLDINFEFIDDDDTSYQIVKENVAEAIKTGYFVHPITGDVLEKAEFESKIFSYFTPTDSLKENHVW